MTLLTFDALRTLAFPPARYIKPEQMFAHRQEIEAADILLFPEYWQINTLLYGLKARIFPSPASYYLGHNKIEQTRAMQAVFPHWMPKTSIYGSSRSSLERVLVEFRFPLVVKAVKSARGEGVALLHNEAELFSWAANHGVLYVQERLEIDRDVRVVWVGDQVLDAYWRLAPKGGFLNNVAQGGEVVRDPVPQAVLDMVACVARQFGIDHAGFDVAWVNDQPYFIEFNRIFGTQGLAGGAKAYAAAAMAYLQPAPVLDELPPPSAA